MKTLFYQVKWSEKIEDAVKEICNKVGCEFKAYQVLGAPTSAKELWFSVKEKDIDYVKKQMNEAIK